MAERFTVGEVEDAARLILLDDYENAYRFEPGEMYAAMKDGLIRLRRERPASRYVGGVLVDLEFVGDGTSRTDIPMDLDDENRAVFRAMEVTMESRWKEAVVYYVVHRMYLKDDADTKNDNLATTYFNMYTAACGG